MSLKEHEPLKDERYDAGNPVYDIIRRRLERVMATMNVVWLFWASAAIQRSRVRKGM
jgi:hypothetical protein